MVTLDFWCETHGFFEVMFLPQYRAFYPCPECEADSEQRWKSSPNLDRTAARVWAGEYHPEIGYYTSIEQRNEIMERKGSVFVEPGFSDDCKRNKEERFQKESQKIIDGAISKLQERTDTELKTLINNEKQIPKDWVVAPSDIGERIGRPI